MPTPYALSSDLVSAWPAKSLEIATYLDTALASKTDLAMTQNAQTGTSYSMALADASKLVTMSNAAANTVLVTKQATVVWVTGTQLRVLNLGAGTTTLVADTGVTINNNTALKQYQGGTLIRTASDVWAFVPNAAGASASAVATVATTQTTTSATFVDLATVGPSVTVTTGTKALIAIACMNTTSAADLVYAGVAVSGATTVAASDLYAIGGYTVGVNVPQTQAANVFMLTGLTPGSNTFTMKYRRASGTATFSQRIITVVDMGS